MSRRWVWRELAMPATEAWALLTDPTAWPRWGPSVRSAVLHGELRTGATGTIIGPLGVSLPFTITDVEPGRRWRWRVAGVPATDHRVEPVAPDRCRVGFGVPWLALPYLLVCRAALDRLARLAAAPPDGAVP